MTIGIFTCFRKIYEQNMKFGIYLILRGLIIGGGAYIRDFTVWSIESKNTWALASGIYLFN